MRKPSAHIGADVAESINVMVVMNGDGEEEVKVKREKKAAAPAATCTTMVAAPCTTLAVMEARDSMKARKFNSLWVSRSLPAEVQAQVDLIAASKTRGNRTTISVDCILPLAAGVFLSCVQNQSSWPQVLLLLFL